MPRQIFEKYSNTKFHQNPSSGSRVVQCGPMEGRTDMTKLEVAFHNFTNAPKSNTSNRASHSSSGLRTSLFSWKSWNSCSGTFQTNINRIANYSAHGI